MRLPNLVIGGAPKCGTTSLFMWLVDHPEVCGSKAKEPLFFVDRGYPLRWRHRNVHDHGLEAYTTCFPDCTDHHKVVVDGSSQYIYQSTALDFIPSLLSNPRLVFLVRKPSERLFSSFAYSKNKGNLRSGLSFTEFVHLVKNQPGPTAQPEWAWRASAYVLPRDIQYSRYIEYLSAWRERLGDGRLRVIVLEEMRADPKAVVKELCDWVGIDPAFYDDYDFAPRNRTSPIRSQLVQRIAHKLGERIGPGPFREAMKGVFYAVQSTGRSEPRSEADKAVLAELDEEFRPYNERLAREFGLDLSAWN